MSRPVFIRHNQIDGDIIQYCHQTERFCKTLDYIPCNRSSHFTVGKKVSNHPSQI